MNAGSMGPFGQATDLKLLAVAAFPAIPGSMIFLSSMLPSSPSRWLNLVVGVLHGIPNALMIPPVFSAPLFSSSSSRSKLLLCFSSSGPLRVGRSKTLESLPCGISRQRYSAKQGLNMKSRCHPSGDRSKFFISDRSGDCGAPVCRLRLEGGPGRRVDEASLMMAMAQGLWVLTSGPCPHRHAGSYSPSESWNTSSTGTSKWRAIFSAITVDGTNRPTSIVLMVLRETPMARARSAWLIRCSARNTRMRLWRALKKLRPKGRDRRWPASSDQNRSG